VVQRKKNSIRKGDGKDAAPDEHDNYKHHQGWAFNVLKDALRSEITAVAICNVVKELSRQAGVTPPNRWAQRRKPNAYSWIDRNKAVIQAEVLCEVARRVSGISDSRREV
jgi:hypothetical protein